MNPILDNIHSRRSVREFEQKPILQDVLKEIIDAGNAAPSGMNTQGWRFVVITDPESRKLLADLALVKYQEWIKSAPTEMQVMRAEIDKLTPDPVYYQSPAIIFVMGTGMARDLDCPMVCQNMMLAARSIGIGSCWVYFGQLPLGDGRVNKLLDLKEGEKVFGPIILGYPKGGFPPAPSKKPAQILWA